MTLAAIAINDALIAVFDAKYHYNFWRPMTAIRNGDIDNNPATDREATWLPIADTPMHPEYPCAHCIISGSVAGVLKAVLGMVPIRSGTVRLDGEIITGRKAHELVQRGVGFVPQNRNVFPSLTVRENLEMGCYIHPQLFGTRLAFVTDMFPRLGERIDQRAGSLSGGERQMVAMGRALMLKPRVLLLDEPSAGLSPALQDQVFLQCRRINGTGVAILMVEQNARRCLQVCDRAYVLDQGQNAYTGTGRELAADPKVIELYLGTLAKAR